MSISSSALQWSVYLIPLLFVAIYWRIKSTKSEHNLKILKDAREAGLTEPATLHPIIDPSLCKSCGACVTACPEGDILGLIKGKAKLINPTLCIGHGACKKACPFDAITLVFGTAKRGIDIPQINEIFETNIPGIFIAGELGGMGLVRNAIEQGKQAIESISKYKNSGKKKMLDVAIIGAGPAGFSATLAAKEKELRYVTLEQDSLGGTVFKFPRGKLVMTAPVTLPLIGKIKFREISKESLLAFWQESEKKASIKINYKEKMENIEPIDQGFSIKTNKQQYTARTILLAIGRRGTPRKLGVPGEDLSKVVYCLIDSEQYRNKHVLVVGGGDAALEAATSIAEQTGTTVTLSYRSDAFSRAKEKNRQKIKTAEAARQIQVLMSSNVKQIYEDKVLIEQNGNNIELPNDAVIISAGGILPTPFLKEIGIIVDTKHGTA